MAEYFAFAAVVNQGAGKFSLTTHTKPFKTAATR
jgi:hypothetical protein